MIYHLLRPVFLLGAALSLLPALAYAQGETETAAISNAPEPDVEAEQEETQPGEEEEQEEAVDLAEEPLVRSGDMLHLKSGQILSEVQILRNTPRFFEVQFVDGLTMQVPRTQVVSVEWDDINPLDASRHQTSPPEGEELSGLRPAMEVGPELKEKLGLPVSETPLIYIDEDIIVILENLTRRQTVAFEVDDSVRALPIEDRTLRLEINPALTFEQLFLDRVPAALPGLVVVYEQDKVRLVTRAVAQQQQAPTPGAAGAMNLQTTPPASPPPAVQAPPQSPPEPPAFNPNAPPAGATPGAFPPANTPPPRPDSQTPPETETQSDK
jgi:hypothetical protein